MSGWQSFGKNQQLGVWRSSANQRKTVTIHTFHVTTFFADNTIMLCRVERVQRKKLTLSAQSDATALFSSVRYTLYELTLTFQSFPIPENQFSKTWQRNKAILWGRGYSRLSYFGIDEIESSHGNAKMLQSQFDQRKPSY